MKYVILNLLQKSKQLEKDEIIKVQPSTGFEDFEDSLLSEDLYESDNQEQSSTNETGRLKKYTFSTSYMVSLKEARMEKERKTPFAVFKAQDKKSTVSEFDNIYATDKKIRYKDQKQGIRVGFIRSSDHLKYSKYDLATTTKLSGIANEEIPIRKKKGFNQKKVGYIKLAEETVAEDYYVEVTKSRGFLWMLMTALMVIALALLIHTHDWSDWKINWNNFSAYKTGITEITEQNAMEIYHQAEVKLDGSTLRLELTSDNKPGQEYKIRVYLGEVTDSNKIYESEHLAAGDSLTSLDIQADGLQPGTYNCTIICDVYRSSGRHLGSFESYFVLKV